MSRHFKQREGSRRALGLIIGGLALVLSQPSQGNEGSMADAPEAVIQVQLSGLDDPVHRNNVLEQLPLYRHRHRTDLSESDIRRFHARSGPIIRQALEPFGYYRVEYTAELEPNASGWRATYNVDPGSPARIDSVDLRIQGAAADLPALDEWRQRFPLRPGDVLEHQPYSNALSELNRTAREHGLHDGRFAQRRIHVSSDGERADIVVHFETGARYLLGDPYFTGSRLRNDFLHRFVAYRPGEPYHTDQLIELQRSLIDAGYFRRVEVIPQFGVGTRVPIEVRLVDQAPTRYTAGFGYGTDTGPRVRGGIERRYINRRGHRAGVDMELSAIQREFTTWYTIPMADPRHEALSTRLTHIETETFTSERSLQRLQTTLTRSRGAWLRTLALSAEEEAYEVGSDTGRTRLLIPRIAWDNQVGNQRHLDTPPLKRLSVDLRGASEGLLSDTDFGQLRVSASDNRPLDTGLRHRLVNRLDLATTAVESIHDLPASLRFFTGGDRSIRGYRYQSIGPKDANGDVIGGKHLAVWGIDYEYRIGHSWAVALFHDAGSAFGPDEFELRRGAGTGLRWYLPVGALALDLARPVEEDGDWRFHLTLRAEL